MCKVNKAFVIILMFLFSSVANAANAGGVIQGSIGVSLTILPNGNSCGVLNDSKICSNNAEKWEQELKNSQNKSIITNENCQAYRDGDFIIVIY